MAWEVEEGSLFKDQANEAFPDPTWQDRVLAGICQTLAIDPHQGHETDEPGIWALATADWPRVNAVTIYYKFDETVVTLLAIRESSPGGVA